jgi:hypothetical protein
MFEREWLTCSRLLNYSRLNIGHNWGDIHGHFTIHYYNKYDIHVNFEITGKMVMTTI